jgi:AhpD family alkylhydroperoxidase
MADYPEQYDRMQKLVARLMRESSAPMAGFLQLHRASQQDGALSRKTKELMALAISISGHCDSCISYHVHDAIKAGASREELLETISVAIMMGGGPALMYGCDALEAIDQFMAAGH